MGGEERGLTYQGAGVDIEAADRFVGRIASLAASTWKPGVIEGIGGFAALFSLKDSAAARMADPVLVSGTDGVGTKLKIAFLADRHDTVGIDLVAMSVNDVCTTGALPLFFLDYFGTGRLDPARADRVIEGIVEGCRRAGCALVGGETAELPGIYAADEYDLAGFAVGVVDRARILDGRGTAPGDLVIGVESRGLHSNGYSLARKVLLEHAHLSLDAVLDGIDRPLGDELLEPTPIYARLSALLADRASPRAFAHITGGGIRGNLSRVLPKGVAAEIDRGAWTPGPIFSHIQRLGDVLDAEMFRTFNMGIGWCAVVPSERSADALRACREAGEVARVVGRIRERAPSEPEVVLDVGGV